MSMRSWEPVAKIVWIPSWRHRERLQVSLEERLQGPVEGKVELHKKEA